MNKRTKKLLIALCIIPITVIMLFTIARLTNMLQYYVAPSPANHPTIKMGDRFYATNLVQPKRFNFICFRTASETGGKETRVYRLCGLEGDKIEIRQGDLYINDKNADGQLSLSHLYTIAMTDGMKAMDAEGTTEAVLAGAATPGRTLAYLSDRNVRSGRIQAVRYILPKEQADEYISKQYGTGTGWNQDNFGPVIVPPGKYFVLGDNRLNAMDSRYTGFVDKADCIATVLDRK